MGEQAADRGFLPKDDGDQHAVDGPTTQGAVPRCRARSHPREVSTQPEMATDMLEVDLEKPGLLWQRGRDCRETSNPICGSF